MTLVRRARRIRVNGVPADFRVPRGWPTPTDKWVRENAFWRPPPGWTPRPSLRAAPDSWVYWVPNNLWSQVTGNYFRSIAVWARISTVLALVYLVTMIAGPLIGYSPLLRGVGFAAAAISVMLLVVHAAMKARMSKRLLTRFAIDAQLIRHDRLVREYQRYLVAVA